MGRHAGWLTAAAALAGYAGDGADLIYLPERDFDLDASLQYPSGFGLSVDASAVKGAGIIQIDQKTGEFFGALELVIIKKIGVGAFVLCDPGTAKGHDFSMVVLLSARFSPGIPLGMGFSLTAIGGTLGLNRQISRDAVQNGVRTGTLDQVFFVENIKEHLAEMKTNVITYFPEKKGQFFFGILGPDLLFQCSALFRQPAQDLVLLFPGRFQHALLLLHLPDVLLDDRHVRFLQIFKL